MARGWYHGRNRWTTDQRLTLTILFERFDVDDDTRAKVFSTIFAEHLRACGVPDGVSARSVTTQYYRRNLDIAEWHEIIRMPTTPEETAKRELITQKCSQILARLKKDPTNSEASKVTKVGMQAARSRGQPTLRRTALINTRRTTHIAKSTVKAVRTVSAVVVRTAPHLFECPAASTPFTPAKSSRASKTLRSQRTNATVTYSPRPGLSLNVTLEEHQIANGAWNWPNDGQPEILGLLYRFWDSQSSQSALEADGFTAGLFKHMRSIPAPPAPSPEYPMWNNMAAHLNRDPVSTAFVSASVDLCWALRNAMNAVQNNEVRFISVIIPTMLPHRPYHAPPFHAECKKRFCFTDAAWFYSGRSEFLCYNGIPSAAVMRTFSLQSLLDFVASTPTAAALLRLGELTQRRVGYAKKREAFKKQAIGLTADTISGMAEISRFLGLDHNSPLGHLAGVVSDLVHGWALVLEQRTTAELETQAATFAAYIYTSDRPPPAKHLQTAKLAFLEGLKWGNARDWNPRFKEVTTIRAVNRAKKAGLDSPIGILSDGIDSKIKELQDAKEALLACNPSHISLPSQRLLATADPEDDAIMGPASSRLETNDQ